MVLKNKISLLFALLITANIFSQELFFANYFDIKTNSKAGDKVFGKINLKSNKDTFTKAIPDSYEFKLVEDPSGIFAIETQRDIYGRVFGVLSVAKKKKTSKKPEAHPLKVLLKDGETTISEVDITIHVVKKTMWEELQEGFRPETIALSRLYGRKKLKGKKLERVLLELEANNGRFSAIEVYFQPPSYYANKGSKALEKELEEVASNIGGLGYAYAKSEKYGIKSTDKTKTERLKRAIYSAVLAYIKIVPINGNELMVDGKSVGDEIGDGFSNNPYYSHGLVTHQWRLSDPLGAPLVHIMPSLLEDIDNGDELAQEVYDAVIHYYQMFFSITEKRRKMNSIDERWKNISDANYSEGAWADANIGHRMRTLMVMPILWADYNRPITYVPYWYDDYYDGTEFEGKTFAKNWSPSGVVTDVRNWCDKLSLPSHMYNQSGFHPDGTVTHHIGHHASDVAMYAYGFEWLITANLTIDYFKNTPYPVPDESYQFVADRMNYTYRRMVYKNGLDFTVAGRSFYADASDFGDKHVAKSLKKLLDGKSPTTTITNEQSVKQLKNNLKKGVHTHSETVSFWNADYLLHRKEDASNDYFFSVKHKSVRTSGAEDFDKVRKSWHAGSGVLLLKVDGDEYNRTVKEGADWHVLPGVTEAWETDPMPKGPASLAMPGLNEFSGMLSNGSEGLAGYHHNSGDSYTSATALKTVHFVNNFGLALGSTIERKSESKKTVPIVTTIDQSLHDADLTYFINDDKEVLASGSANDLSLTSSQPFWLHHQNKGYLVYPKGEQTLFIKTGIAINVTDTKIKNNQSKNYILALDHGTNPEAATSSYNYVLVANVTAEDMPELLNSFANNTEIATVPGEHHAVSFKAENIQQVSFFKPGTVTLGDQPISANEPVLVMLKDKGPVLELTVTDPLHSLKTETVSISISQELQSGTYNYSFGGIYPREGETASVSVADGSSIITIELPDARDGEFYNYQEEMYAGAPIVLELKKK